jgi:hypothetical protein
MKTESKTYTITLKTLCGKETTKVIEAQTPKEAFQLMLKQKENKLNAKITKK